MALRGGPALRLAAALCFGLMGFCALGFGVVAAAPAAPPAATARRAASRVEQHIEDLHRRLAITPGQTAEWDAFAAVLRQNARDVEQVHAETQPSAGKETALDAMRSYAARARVHAANLDRLLPVFQALYTSLTPEQRATADKTFQAFQDRPTPRP